MTRHRTRVAAACASVGILIGGVLVTSGTAVAAMPAVPALDHVVVVVMENHSAAQVLGNAQAPYINALAAGGASMTRSYAVTHPSQPNYIALFAGSTLGVTTNACPLALDGPNLATSLAAAGRSFAIYSEDLPSTGYTGCEYNGYARKHNPVVNFASVPASANQSLTAFPTDYATLPSVSFLIPNLQHDMHDGTIAQADAWLQATIDGYVTWAKANNSLLVLTFDEDDDSAGNQIATVLSGADVVPGTYPEQITHYNVLRTIADANGIAPLGLSADAAPILSVWGDPGNRQPTASFTSSSVGLAAAYDGTGSSDPDGSIASFAWAFGDGTTGSGAAASHVYAQPGTYVVTLTVTDDGGAVGSRSSNVAVGNGIASDSYGRTVSGGWGAADVGGPWVTSGTTSNYAVSAGAGTMRIAASSSPGAMLRDVTSSGADLAMTLTTDKPATGSGLYLYVVGRRVAGAGDYRAKLRLQSSGATSILLERVTTTSAETFLTAEVVVPGLAFAPGTPVRVRTQVTGTNPTTLRARVWKAGTTEPATWHVSAVDATTAYQSTGQLGLVTYLSSSATNAPITLLVDDLVATSTAQPPPVNSPPTAAFTWSTSGLGAVLDATGSTDVEGPVAAYLWSYGDGTSGTGSTSNHAYATAGTYTVGLTVTDSGGLTSTASHPVVVSGGPPPDAPPTAAFTSTSTGLTASLDGTGSTDAEGPVVAYAWDYGDGGTGTGATTAHTYAAAGTFVVTLTVADTGGRTGTVTHPVTVTAPPPPNTAPTASFTAGSAQLTASFDARGSSDAEGPIASYAWAFGDGTSGTGATASRTYTAAGTYSVTLVVTDAGGLTGTATRTVTVSAPPPPPALRAADEFARSVVNGWGSADVGGPWTLGGTASAFAVSGGVGTVRVSPGSGPTAFLRNVSSADTDLALTLSTDKPAAGSGLYLSVAGRRVNGVGDYRAKVRLQSSGATSVLVQRVSAGNVETNLSADLLVPGLTHAVGTQLRIRVLVTGTNPTTVRAKVWKVGTVEPAWQVGATDATAGYQAAGQIGLVPYLSSGAGSPITVSVDSLDARASTP